LFHISLFFKLLQSYDFSDNAKKKIKTNQEWMHNKSPREV